jgi:hypothetical protein
LIFFFHHPKWTNTHHYSMQMDDVCIGNIFSLYYSSTKLITIVSCNLTSVVCVYYLRLTI